MRFVRKMCAFTFRISWVYDFCLADKKKKETSQKSPRLALELYLGTIEMWSWTLMTYAAS